MTAGTLAMIGNVMLRLTRGHSARRGTAAIEFALIAPLFIVIVIEITELGFAAYQAQQVQSAVEAGMLYAAKRGWDANGVTQAILSATDATGLSATPAPAEFCGCPETASIAPADCSVQCADGSPVGQYVQVSAALPRQSILPAGALPLPDTLSARATVRVR